MMVKKYVIQYKRDSNHKIKELSIINTGNGLQNSETWKPVCTPVDIDAAKLISNALNYYNSLKE